MKPRRPGDCYVFLDQIPTSLLPKMAKMFPNAKAMPAPDGSWMLMGQEPDWREVWENRKRRDEP